MRRIFAKIAFYYLPLLLWSGMIFYFSSLSGSGDYQSSTKVFLERKAAHIFEYAILAVLLLRCFLADSSGRRNSSYYWALFSAFIYSVSDEIHQVFVFGRTGRPLDVAIDLLGIVLGLLMYLYFQEKLKNSRKL